MMHNEIIALNSTIIENKYTLWTECRTLFTVKRGFIYTYPTGFKELKTTQPGKRAGWTERLSSQTITSGASEWTPAVSIFSSYSRPLRAWGWGGGTSTTEKSVRQPQSRCKFPKTESTWTIIHIPAMKCGLGSVVGIATGYGLDGPGIEFRWKQDFPYLSRPALGPTQPPVQWVPGLSRGVKSGRGVTLIPHPLLVPWSWKSRAIPLLPLWAVRPV
jgi:hypothetical protein